ncbi:hypothetical protein Bhyg_04616 [Pseudolycoriella hygida]|uniref:Ribosomal protein S36 n=1 Tax=Pseudolycoriella hygida TaxID=35572 RepID=A0A9Q0NFK8_9DIPT|nr:hypothetical protein Bhyg_04616 [Pseudolycoriella hygida]
MVKTSLTNLAKRMPMIRFRYGLGRESVKNISTSESYAHPSATLASSSSIPRGSSGPALEHWQLPARYQRKPIDKYEMEVINRGGRE